VALMSKNPLAILGVLCDVPLVWSSILILVVEFLRDPGWIDFFCNFVLFLYLPLAEIMIVARLKLALCRGLHEDLRRWNGPWRFSRIDLLALCETLGLRVRPGGMLDLSDREAFQFKRMGAATAEVFRVHPPEGASSGGNVCYGTSFTETFVMLESDENEDSVPTKFYIIHELAHTLYAANYGSVAAFKRTQAVLAVSALGLAACAGPLVPTAALVVLVACLAILSTTFYSSSYLKRETAADVFALLNLNDRSRDRLARVIGAYATHPVLSDTKMSDRDNQRRSQRLMALLEAKRLGDAEFEWLRMLMTPSRLTDMISRGFLRSSLFGLVSTLGAAALIVAACTIELPHVSLQWALASQFVLFVVTEVSTLRADRYLRVIRARLANQIQYV
jgi:hypothetical protein